MAKKCGIYTITNLVNGKIYVGYTINLNRREKEHMNCLSKIKHHNTHLQNSVNKHGLENFVFEILEECEEKFLASQEHYWCNVLNVHNSKYGYNDKPTHPDNKVIFSKENKIKYSQNRIGKKLSPEHSYNVAQGQRNRNKKAIVVFDEDSNFLGEFEFYLDFLKAFNIKETLKGSIKRVLDKKHFIYKNYRILYKSDSEINCSNIKARLVGKYSKSGELLIVYKSRTDAEYKEGFYSTYLSKYLLDNKQITDKYHYYMYINKILLVDNRLIYKN